MIPVRFLLIASLALCGSVVNGKPQLWPSFPLGGFGGGAPAPPSNPIDADVIATVLGIVTGKREIDIPTVNFLINKLAAANPATRDIILNFVDTLAVPANRNFVNGARLLNSVGITDPKEVVAALSTVPGAFSDVSLDGFRNFAWETTERLTLTDLKKIASAINWDAFDTRLLKGVEEVVSDIGSGIGTLVLGVGNRIGEAASDLGESIVTVVGAAENAYIDVRDVVKSATGTAANLKKIHEKCATSGSVRANVYLACVLRKIPVGAVGRRK